MGFAFPIDNGCWVQGSMGHLQCCPTAAELPYTWLTSPLLCRHSSWEGGRRRVVWLGLLPEQLARGCSVLQTGSPKRSLVWCCWPVTKGTSQTVLGTFLSNEGEGYFDLLTTDRLVSFLRIVTDVCVCMWTKFPFNFSEEGTNWGKESPESWNLNQPVGLYFSYFCEIHIYVFVHTYIYIYIKKIAAPD